MSRYRRSRWTDDALTPGRRRAGHGTLQDDEIARIRAERDEHMADQRDDHWVDVDFDRGEP